MSKSAVRLLKNLPEVDHQRESEDLYKMHRIKSIFRRTRRGSPAETKPAVISMSTVQSPLEALPPEVRRHLLSMLRLEELRALVRSSPVFYQQYLLDRKLLLWASLTDALHGATVDARAVYWSSSARFSAARSKASVTQFLTSYRHQRTSAQQSIADERPSEEEAVSMTQFFFSVIKPFVGHYTRWTMARLADETHGPPYRERISKIEELRILRALYRFQLCCNLFGVGRDRKGWQLRLKFTISDIWAFLCLFEPWEVEEIACIHTFFKVEYERIFESIRWDVREDNPKFDGDRPPTPVGSFDLDGWMRDELLRGIVSYGPKLLHTVLFKITSHEKLVLIMQKHLMACFSVFLDNALDERAQLDRRIDQPSDRDRMEEQRRKLPFRGDGVLDTGVLGPPLVWTIIWRGTYSNTLGDYIPDDIRRWGYVMWDAKTLGRTGANKVLRRQWEASWHGTDPRDEQL